MPYEDLQKEIETLKARNARVEDDKAWETSRFRVYSIAAITYIVATVVLISIGNEQAFRNALVPVAGYLLSTQSLPFLKKWWVSKRHP